MKKRHPNLNQADGSWGNKPRPQQEYQLEAIVKLLESLSVEVPLATEGEMERPIVVVEVTPAEGIEGAITYMNNLPFSFHIAAVVKDANSGYPMFILERDDVRVKRVLEAIKLKVAPVG